MTWRQKGLTYAVVVPFAIFLAFPFYFALVTMFKTNLDLANVEHSPYLYNDLEGGFHWDFWNYATTEHVRFLFEDTNYPKWLLNTLLVGAAVVGDHAAPRHAGGLRARAARRRLGPERGGRDLPRLPDPADAALPSALAADHAARPQGLALVADPHLPVLHGPLRDLAPDGVLQDDPAGARGRGADRRRVAPEGALPDHPPHLAAGDPDRRSSSRSRSA